MPQLPMKANKYLKNGDKWQMHGLGMILLSGVERSIFRLHDSSKSRAYFKQLGHVHSKINVTSNDMIAAMEIMKPYVIEAVIAYHHDSKATDDEIRELEHLWQRYFIHMADMVSFSQH